MPLFGSVPTPPKKPKSCTNTHVAAQSTTALTKLAYEGLRHETEPDDGEGDDHEDIDRQAVASCKAAEGVDQARQHVGLVKRRHLTRHAGQTRSRPRSRAPEAPVIEPLPGTPRPCRGGFGDR